MGDLVKFPTEDRKAHNEAKEVRLLLNGKWKEPLSVLTESAADEWVYSWNDIEAIFHEIEAIIRMTGDEDAMTLFNATKKAWQ